MLHAILLVVPRFKTNPNFGFARVLRSIRGSFCLLFTLAVVMGEQPTGGYGIAVTEARAGTANAPLTVLVRETRPPKDATVTQALTSPLHFVSIPLWAGAVQFAVVDDPIAP